MNGTWWTVLNYCTLVNAVKWTPPNDSTQANTQKLWMQPSEYIQGQGECNQVNTLKVNAAEWNHQSECTQINALKWMQQNEWIQVNASEWLHPNECTRVNASMLMHLIGGIQFMYYTICSIRSKCPPWNSISLDFLRCNVLHKFVLV